MKKALKIILISLASLLVVFLLAVSVLMWVVLTPERLTPIVQKQLSESLACEASIDSVELTFFSSFPILELKSSNLLLKNPLPGNPTDTLLYASRVEGRVSLRELLFHRRVIVDELNLHDVLLSAYIAPDGRASYDIMLPDDTPDTTAFELPFESVDLHKVVITNARILYYDTPMDMTIDLYPVQAEISMNMKGSEAKGNLVADAGNFSFYWDSLQYVLQEPLQLSTPWSFDMNDDKLVLNKGSFTLDSLDFGLSVLVDNIPEKDAMFVDVDFASLPLRVKPVLQLLELPWGSMLEGITMDGIVLLDGEFKGMMGGGQQPQLILDIDFEACDFAYEGLPYKLFDMSGKARVDMDMNDSDKWFVEVTEFDAGTGKSRLAGSGLIDQLMGDMRFDLKVVARLNLDDLKPMLPDDMPISIEGKAKGDARIGFLYSEFMNDAYDKMEISTRFELRDLLANYDTIRVESPLLYADIKMPNRKQSSMSFIDMTINAATLNLQQGSNTKGDIDSLRLKLTSSNPMLNDIRSTIDFSVASLTGNMDSLLASTKHTAGRVHLDMNLKDSVFVPTGRIKLQSGSFTTPMLPETVHIPIIDLDFSTDGFDIRDSRLQLGASDFSLQGQLSNLEAYMKNTGLLKGDFDFRSTTTDVNQLMAMTSGLGQDTMNTDTVDMNLEAKITSTNGGPFMVPKGIDITLRANVDEAYFAKDTLRQVEGSVTIKDGDLVMESMLFTASAARMQLTGLYRTPRTNHIFMGLDFHLLDIEIAELLAMIPDIDSIMPMLRSFDGKGEFHLAIETYVDSTYRVKPSTIRGVSSLRGEDLVLMDGETFAEIARNLQFSRKAENKVDSISAEFTIFRKEVDIYPFLIVMDRYKAVVSGRHTMDMNFDYHISLIESPLPFKLGVDVKGNLDDYKVRLVPRKYGDLYRPARRNSLQEKQMDIRRMIREALQDKVKE